MTLPYNKYYQTKNLFGEAYPELIQFFVAYPNRGKILDLGCGQGRDAIALARLGYAVTGIDNSKVGIEQMNQISQNENLNLKGQVCDIYSYNRFVQFDIVLMDSMFHFSKKDKKKEIELIKKIISAVKTGSLLVFCIQNTGDKIQILNQIIDSEKIQKRLADKGFKYTFEDRASRHKSETNYKMIVIEK